MANQLTFKLAFVGICHQFNWDFLQERLAEHLLSIDLSEMVQRLSKVRADELSQWLSGYKKPERIQAVSRAAMLRSIGHQLLTDGGSPVALVSAARNRIGGPSGFVAQLDRFSPYKVDPLRKKSNVLVQDLIRERVVVFEDEESLQPAVDYHIMRIYLRSGRVVPLYSVVADVLHGNPRPRPRLVRLLRETVADALRVTASYARLSVVEVNYIEWQLGRSVCERRTPACMRSERPVGLDADIAKLFDCNCPYMAFCRARRDPEGLKLREPQFVSTFY